MIRKGYLLSLLLVFMLACGNIPSSAPSPTLPVQEIVDPSELPNSALVDVYDPARNPAEDLKQAIALAQKENKRIILELGGDWCIWCKYMDDFYAAHTDILQYRAENYVLVKVNVSDENMNEEFLSQYPPAGGYPHIYILDGDGTFLHSQDTVELEDGKDSYVPEVFMTFLQKWAPPAK
ncbi:MAG TPA: thioredoxin family protein [Anaerolineales bacterium]|nr:thioredoxin family protein [Anaerolineales bacterium]